MFTVSSCTQWPPAPAGLETEGVPSLPCGLPPTSCSSQQIYYWEADSRNETEKMKVLFLPETAVKLKNLTSHTKYLVSISAFNAAGDGPKSDPRQGHTHEAGRKTVSPFHRPLSAQLLRATAPSSLSSCPMTLRAEESPFLSVPTALCSACPITHIPCRWA